MDRPIVPGASACVLDAGPWSPYIHAADGGSARPPWRVPRRRLAHWLAVCSLAGEEQLVVAGRAVIVPAGASYLIQPGQLADLGSARGSRPAWVHFDLRYDVHRQAHPHASAYAAELGPRRRFLQPDDREAFGCRLPVLVPAPVAAEFRTALPRVARHWAQGGALAGPEAAWELAGLLLSLVRQVRGDQPAEPAQRLARSMAMARNRIDDPSLCLDDLARVAALSRSRFCAWWQRVEGGSPIAWLLAQRMALAKQLLHGTELSAAAVGRQVGYPDPTIFGRRFRAAWGTSPQRWRGAAEQGSRGSVPQG